MTTIRTGNIEIHRHYIIILVAVLFVAGFILRLGIVLQPLPVLSANGPLIDDGFIALTLARSIARGDGPKLDSRTRTNGFQPLWVYLCVPFFCLLSDDMTAATGILMLSALLSWLSAILLFMIVKRLSGETAAFIAAIMWLFHPHVLRHTLNGLETGLSALLLLTLVHLYLNSRYGDSQDSGGPFEPSLSFWLVLTATFLARIDSLLLLPGFLALIVQKSRQKQRHVLLMGMTTLPIFGWCFASWMTLGSFLPESGTAVRLISLCYQDRFCLLANCTVSPECIPLSYYLSNLFYAVITIERAILSLITPLLMPWKASREPVLGFLLFPGFLLTLFCIAGLLTMSLTDNRTTAPGIGSGVRRELIVLFGFYSVFLIAGYIGWSFGQWFYHRYFFPLFIISLGLLAAISVRISSRTIEAFCRGEWNPCRHSRSLLLSGVLVVITVGYGIQSLDFFRPVDKPFAGFEIAVWLRENTPDTLTIGCFQAGTIAFFCPDRRVVCLDGVVNGDARRALALKRIDHYIDSCDLDIIVDWPWILDYLLEKRSDNWDVFMKGWEPLFSLPDGFAGIKKRERNVGPRSRNSDQSISD